jgi:hypothetical protein
MRRPNLLPPTLALIPILVGVAGFKPPTPIGSGADEYRWRQDVAGRAIVVTTTDKLPVKGKVLGRRGELLVAITPTGTYLYVNVTEGPGLSTNWKEVQLS